MNSKERITSVLDGKIPDRVPIDFGATPVTGIAASILYNIKKHYGLLEPGERIKVIEPYQMLGEIDRKTRNFFGFDVVGVFPPKNLFGFSNEGWKPWDLFDGTPVLVPQCFNTEPDQQGNIPMYAQGDTDYPPCAIMPKGGFYFDSIMRQNPVDWDNLKVKDNLEEFVSLTENDLRYFEDQVKKAYQNTNCAVLLILSGAAFGDIALVPAPFLKNPKGIRDVAEWYMATASHPDHIKKIFQAQAEIALENIKALHGRLGEMVNIVFMSGTDFGTQIGTFVSRQTYRNLFFPFHKKLNKWIHKNTNWKIFMHSCGAIEPLIEDFIEAGFDIINPVQCSATGMEPEKLKSKYSRRITFWGAGVDTQQTLPFGNPTQVKEEVSERMAIFKAQGGFVFNIIHNLQANVPIENIVAMFDAFKENADYNT